ncbi:hypothetical protein [Mesorhizobium sp.]|uniref:hypothetical protein n=1 Tax=Mesorhizobium sp. TaxID=1871066 RepID=UPI000FE8B662|nr:hypothetical protein [Mesorhizobium sp.]RWA64401.1 MAG: hypothetical protein EOQ27_09655 [Mesorhizobium sp.]
MLEKRTITLFNEPRPYRHPVYGEGEVIGVTDATKWNDTKKAKPNYVAELTGKDGKKLMLFLDEV